MSATIDGRRSVRRPGLPPLASYMVALAIAGLARRPVAPADAADLKGDARAARHGRGAASPVEIPARGWWDIAVRTVGEIGNDRILAVAAGVTFYGLLALFPAIGSLVSLYGLFSDPATLNDHLSAMNGLMPGGAIDIIGEQVKRITANGTGALGFAFFSGLAVSLWSANAGMKAVFDALNVAYQEDEKRNFFWLNLWSLGFTVGALVFIVAALSTVVIIPVALKFVGLGAATEWILWAGRWPALLLVTLAALAVLYRYGPSRRPARWRWLSPGASFASVGWLATSMLFSWYVSSFGSYNQTYGSLGAVIGFMTWLWLSSTVILVGAELNAETEHQTVVDSTKGGSAPLGRRGAKMADTVAGVR